MEQKEFYSAVSTYLQGKTIPRGGYKCTSELGGCICKTNMTLEKTCIHHARKINFQIKPNMNSIPLSPGVTDSHIPGAWEPLGRKAGLKRSWGSWGGVPKQSPAWTWSGRSLGEGTPGSRCRWAAPQLTQAQYAQKSGPARLRQLSMGIWSPVSSRWVPTKFLTTAFPPADIHSIPSIAFCGGLAFAWVVQIRGKM